MEKKMSRNILSKERIANQPRMHSKYLNVIVLGENTRIIYTFLCLFIYLILFWSFYPTVHGKVHYHILFNGSICEIKNGNKFSLLFDVDEM